MSNFELFIKRSKINLEEYFRANNINNDEELKEYCQANNLDLPSKKYFHEKPVVSLVSEEVKTAIRKPKAKKPTTSKAVQQKQVEEATPEPAKPAKPKRQTRTRRTRKKKE